MTGTNVPVVQVARHATRRQLHQISHELRPMLRDDGKIQQVLHTGSCGVLRRLHGQLVGNLFIALSQKFRRGLKAAAQRNQCALGYIAGRQANLRHSCALDVHVQRGQRKQLLQRCTSAVPGIMAHLVGDLLRNIVTALHVVPTICTSMGAGKPKFRICVTISAGWKKKLHSRKTPWPVPRADVS